MEKLYTSTIPPKQLLKRRQRDKVHSFLLADGRIRGAFVQGTLMLDEMRMNFGHGLLETYVLGQAYLAGALLTANLKGNDRLALHLECAGPLKGYVVEATATGEIRGYLKTPQIPLEKPLESFDLSPLMGPGFLTVTKHLVDAKQPYEGKVPLMHGSLANDLAEYFLTSEQTPTAFTLSIRFDDRGELTGAGGLFLQAMPDAGEKLTAALETLVADLPSIGDALTEGQDAETYIMENFAAFDPRVIGNRRVEFFCRCSKEQMKAYLLLLPEADRHELYHHGPSPLELKCNNCNSAYHFEKDELVALIRPRADA